MVQPARLISEDSETLWKLFGSLKVTERHCVNPKDSPVKQCSSREVFLGPKEAATGGRNVVRKGLLAFSLGACVLYKNPWFEWLIGLPGSECIHKTRWKYLFSVYVVRMLDLKYHEKDMEERRVCGSGSGSGEGQRSICTLCPSLVLVTVLRNPYHECGQCTGPH